MFGIDDAIIGAVAAPIIGGLFGASGQSSANSANAAINAQNTAFNAEEAQKNRDFQQYNADTQWQRSVSDMQQAGLSPMLAYMKGGNSVPSGSAATAASAVPMGNVGAAAAAGAQSAVQMANMAQDTANKLATKSLIEAQTTSAVAGTELTKAQTLQVENMTTKISQEIENMPLNVDILKRTSELLYQQASSTYGDVLNKAQQYEVLKQTAAKLVADTKLANLDISAAEGLGNLGREMGQLKPIFDMLVTLIRSSHSR